MPCINHKDDIQIREAETGSGSLITVLQKLCTVYATLDPSRANIVRVYWFIRAGCICDKGDVGIVRSNLWNTMERDSPSKFKSFVEYVEEIVIFKTDLAV